MLKNRVWKLFFDHFDITMSLISKNGSGGAGQKRIWSHGDLFRELFYLLDKIEKVDLLLLCISAVYAQCLVPPGASGKLTYQLF